MSKCEQCGGQGSDLFEVVRNGESRKFDSFDCAIQFMAAPCDNCGCLITGQTHRLSDRTFCCPSCLSQSGLETPILSETV